MVELTYTIEGNPSEYKLRDVIVEKLGGAGQIAYSGGEWRRYKAGAWTVVEELGIQKQVSYVVEKMVEKPSYSRERNVTLALRSRAHREAGEWDIHPNIIVFENCALDTSNMAVIEHDPNHYATRSLKFKYDPDATAPTWEKVVTDLLGEDERLFFQEFCGYCLTTRVELQTALWLIGPPGGGKSTLITGMEAMLGNLAGTLGLKDLERSNFALSDIPGKTLLTCTETPRQHIKTTDILNALITGDTMRVEEKYKKGFDHKNTAKFVWAMNSLPGLQDPNNGLFRRVKLLEIPGIPESKRDSRVIDSVAREATGIINWSLEGLERLNERGHFQFPESVNDATRAFKQSNDLAGLFLDERCELQPQDSFEPDENYAVMAGALNTAFNDWATENAYNKRNSGTLAQEWKRNNLVNKHTNKGKKWYGVRLR